ncbi:MAG: mannitol-1-phosphate 5-dehydrogenase [Spirochaetales bacterium]
MPRFVQFGAGNIGRSFIGRLFAEAGYETVFVDVDVTLVGLLNARGSYPVVVKQTGLADEVRTVTGVRAVNGRDLPAVIAEVFAADYAATSVGQRALESVLPVLAQGLVARQQAGRPALTLIIAENLRGGAEFFRQTLKKALPADFPLERAVGLVETSIGKMVPLMPREALEDDPLQLFAEPYDTLIVDRKGFAGPLPKLAGLKPVDNVPAYVDRKLFMHNMSHAATAYLGYEADPSLVWVWQALELPRVVAGVARALDQSASALLAAYPGEFSSADLSEHARDLLTRYRNRALGDTLHRVGRDLARKLSRDDRLIGACLLADRHGLPYDAIARAAGAALSFAAPDENGRHLPGDEALRSALLASGAKSVLAGASGLDPGRLREAAVLAACLKAQA